MLGRPKGAYTVARCLADYIGWLKDARRSARHVQAYANAHILPALGPLDCEALTTERIEAWRTAIRRSKPRARFPKGRDPAYRPRMPTPPRPTARRGGAPTPTWSISAPPSITPGGWGGSPRAPTCGCGSSPTTASTARAGNYLTEDHACLLVNTCPPGLKELVQLALLTGARYGELCAFDVRDFDARNGSLYVRQSKNGRPRHIVLSDEGVALCRRLATGRPLTQPLLVMDTGARWRRDLHRRPFKEACAHIGLDPAFTFHELRHTWASLAVMNGAELIVVAENLGHRDTRMVERVYGHLAHTYVARRIRETAPSYGFAVGSNVTGLKHPR